MLRSVLVPVAALATAAGAAHGAFTSFVIRNASSGGTPPTIQPNNAYVPGATEFVIAAGGQKAGWGTNDYAGETLGNITNMSITRYDNPGRFAAGSGPAVAPYFNIWVTDGTNYAVVANEPSNPSFAAYRTSNPGGGFTYSFSIAQIAAEQCNVFETPNASTKNTWIHQALNKVGQQLTFADVLNLTLGAPSPSYIAAGNGIGSGAPRQLGTNNAVAINWIFGDSLTNYVSGMEGYVVGSPSVVPAPGAAALLGLGGLTAARRRRR
jgi:MYXO-CTERM domain-containing protein